MGRDTSKSADIINYDADDPEDSIHRRRREAPRRRRTGWSNSRRMRTRREDPIIAAWTNGARLVILHREDPDRYVKVPRLPHATETLSDMYLNEQVTLEDLKKHADELVTERLTLKSVILDLEDLVLANAGVDTFEEECSSCIYANSTTSAQRGAGGEIGE